jgi:hypothetical protein
MLNMVVTSSLLMRGDFLCPREEGHKNHPSGRPTVVITLNTLIHIICASVMKSIEQPIKPVQYASEGPLGPDIDSRGHQSGTESFAVKPAGESSSTPMWPRASYICEIAMVDGRGPGSRIS